MKMLLIFCWCLAVAAVANAEETFVTIHKVSGNRIVVSKEDQSAGRRGGGRFQGNSDDASRGRRGRGAAQSAPQAVVTIAADVKITGAMRERRTSDFMVLAELPGGLRNSVFRNMKQPLSARVITEGKRILEINVLTPVTDINQSLVDADGEAVIAVRPKRPPMKENR
ncbi:hypothetical protein [Stratiformator vulcanicus]|uniref:Preprotein translocase subunit SecD n=1 Tax=Stratiformator vulcanicus TaxID=2527980 RepID=A0A517R1F0_9PLAN|nr:hypothetical protein [Stratiformator vulcanicus]QDT37718.1 hypothetical protein Pan189_21000 [Stratiformator vulcanicus]